MASPDEKYHGYNIFIKFEGLIRNFEDPIPVMSFYQTRFIIRNRKTNKAFGIFCRVSDLHIKGGGKYADKLSEEEVPDVLKESGLRKVRELIDSGASQQFKDEDEYIGCLKFVDDDEVGAPIFEIGELTKKGQCKRE